MSFPLAGSQLRSGWLPETAAAYAEHITPKGFLLETEDFYYGNLGNCWYRTQCKIQG